MHWVYLRRSNGNIKDWIIVLFIYQFLTIIYSNDVLTNVKINSINHLANIEPHHPKIGTISIKYPRSMLSHDQQQVLEMLPSTQEEALAPGINVRKILKIGGFEQSYDDADCNNCDDTEEKEALKSLERLDSPIEVRPDERFDVITSFTSPKMKNYLSTSKIPSGRYIERMFEEKNESVKNNSMSKIIKPEAINHYHTIRGLPFSSGHLQQNPTTQNGETFIIDSTEVPNILKKRDIPLDTEYNLDERQELASYFHNADTIRENYLNSGRPFDHDLPSRKDAIYERLGDDHYVDREINHHQGDVVLRVQKEQNKAQNLPQDSNGESMFYLVDALDYSVLENPDETTVSTGSNVHRQSKPRNQKLLSRANKNSKRTTNHKSLKARNIKGANKIKGKKRNTSKAKEVKNGKQGTIKPSNKPITNRKTSQKNARKHYRHSSTTSRPKTKAPTTPFRREKIQKGIRDRYTISKVHKKKKWG